MHPKTDLQSLLDRPLRQHPDKLAIKTATERVSYGELDARVRSAAAGLRGQGVAPGDRVAWLLPNCLEAVVTTLACYQLGAIAVPLNYRYVEQEVGDVLQRTRARLLVFHATRREAVAPLLAADPELFAVQVGGADRRSPSFDLLMNQQPTSEFAEVDPNHPALILFTSGSTGRPKGVVHSHVGAFCAIEVSREVFDFDADDVVLVGKSISHAGGLQTQLMPALMVGATVLLAKKPKPAEAARWINEHAVTEYGMLASDLLDFVEWLEANPTPLPSLVNSIGSGDSVPEDLHHRFRDLLGWEVMEGAGMTEVGGYYAVNPRHGQRKWGSLGLPTPHTELRIVDEQGTPCLIGEMGEIVLRSPSTTTGYWEDVDATADLYRGGWLHTGDLGRQDEDGYIWFVGRKKLMIVRRGSNIAPAEVESVIDAHPLVHASVVVALPDSRDGQVPVACVALSEPQQRSMEPELRRFVAEHLAAYKNPTQYLFLDELPRTGSGKFDRHRLQELAAQKLAPA